MKGQIHSNLLTWNLLKFQSLPSLSFSTISLIYKSFLSGEFCGRQTKRKNKNPKFLFHLLIYWGNWQCLLQ
ncbi:hypothetical protein V6N13_132704 [Hibiscus sabdariffa]